MTLPTLDGVVMWWLLDSGWSRDSHPISGLFGSFAAASLPRLTATCRATPGLRVGSTLDGGPNWADDANRFLVACEVHSGVVIALMRCRARVALPATDVLNMPTHVAGLRRRIPGPQPPNAICTSPSCRTGAAAGCPRRHRTAPAASIGVSNNLQDSENSPAETGTDGRSVRSTSGPESRWPHTHTSRMLTVAEMSVSGLPSTTKNDAR
jgi:hypothetical protein